MPPHWSPPPDAPPHPGTFVRELIAQSLGLSVKEAAQALGVHRVALSRLINEQVSLSPEMAIRLQKAFGASLEELMRMQNDYDIACARAHQHEIEVSRFESMSRALAQPSPGRGRLGAP